MYRRFPEELGPAAARMSEDVVETSRLDACRSAMAASTGDDCVLVEVLGRWARDDKGRGGTRQGNWVVWVGRGRDLVFGREGGREIFRSTFSHLDRWWMPGKWEPKREGTKSQRSSPQLYCWPMMTWSTACLCSHPLVHCTSTCP